MGYDLSLYPLRPLPCTGILSPTSPPEAAESGCFCVNLYEGENGRKVLVCQHEIGYYEAV